MRETNLGVAIAQPGLPVSIELRRGILAHNGVSNDAIMARRHNDHRLGAKDQALVVAQGNRLRADFQPRHAGIVVEQVQVLLGLQTDDIADRSPGLCASHEHNPLQNPHKCTIMPVLGMRERCAFRRASVTKRLPIPHLAHWDEANILW